MIEMKEESSVLTNVYQMLINEYHKQVYATHLIT